MQAFSDDDLPPGVDTTGLDLNEDSPVKGGKKMKSKKKNMKAVVSTEAEAGGDEVGLTGRVSATALL